MPAAEAQARGRGRPKGSRAKPRGTCPGCGKERCLIPRRSDPLPWACKACRRKVAEASPVRAAKAGYAPGRPASAAGMPAACEGPCPHPPGSEMRVATLEARAAARLPLWREGDCTGED